jgi:hypothetical protein
MFGLCTPTLPKFGVHKQKQKIPESFLFYCIYCGNSPGGFGERADHSLSIPIWNPFDGKNSEYHYNWWIEAVSSYPLLMAFADMCMSLMRTLKPSSTLTIGMKRTSALSKS